MLHAFALADLSSLSSSTLYLGCAVAGGAVLSVQMLLLFLGGDVADGEVDLSLIHISEPTRPY